jgi:hypothetical protein
LGGLLSKDSYRSSKVVAGLRDRFDIAVLTAGITQYLAKAVHSTVDGVLVREELAVWPQSCSNLLAGHYLAGPGEKGAKEQRRLAGDRQVPTIPSKDA